MNEQLKQHIENLGFNDAEAFVRWQLTHYLLQKIAGLEARAHVFRQKYGMDYASFEKRMEEREEEVFEEWDDSIEWEGLEVSLNHAKKMLTEMEAEGQAVYNEEDIKPNASDVFEAYYKKVENKKASDGKTTG